MGVKIEWGLPEITLPAPGEPPSGHAIEGVRQWIEHLARQGLAGGAMGLEQQINQIHKVLILNAVLAYLALAGQSIGSPSINAMRAARGIPPLPEPEPIP